MLSSQTRAMFSLTTMSAGDGTRGGDGRELSSAQHSHRSWVVRGSGERMVCLPADIRQRGLREGRLDDRKVIIPILRRSKVIKSVVGCKLLLLRPG